MAARVLCAAQGAASDGRSAEGRRTPAAETRRRSLDEKKNFISFSVFLA